MFFPAIEPAGPRRFFIAHTTERLPAYDAFIVKDENHGAKVVVLSRGMAECLQVPPETLDFLKERQIAAHVLPTAEAVELYNQLAENEPVGGLFHTTC